MLNNLDVSIQSWPRVRFKPSPMITNFCEDLGLGWRDIGDSYSDSDSGNDRGSDNDRERDKIASFILVRLNKRSVIGGR